MRSLLLFSTILFSFTAINASAELCFNKVKLRPQVSCHTDNGDSTCEQICFEGEEVGGIAGSPTSGCSLPEHNVSTKRRQLIDEVKEIFANAKKQTGGKLNYCLDKTYFQGKYLGEQFSAKEFLDLVKEEEALKISSQSSKTIEAQPDAEASF